MTNTSFSWPLFEKAPLVGILRNYPVDKMVALAKCYEKAGLANLEITMNSAGVEESIKTLRIRFPGKLNVGAGTVCNLEDLETALEAGAQFIVMPVVEEEVIRACADRKIPVFPGALTPTEVFRAWNSGASMVKVFPAGQMGPQYIKDLLAPLNNIKLLPTGGITLDNMGEYLEAGASGLGMGSHLIPKSLIEQEDWVALTRHFSSFVEKFNALK